MLAAIHAIDRRQASFEEAANLRAGLVAAAVYNVNRKKGTRPVHPRDFFRRRVEWTVEETEAALDAWMIRQNQRHKA